MAQVACVGITKRFAEVTALRDVRFEVDQGRTLLIRGPSGSGKTTLLRIISGLETPEEGSVRIAGEVVTGPGVSAPPHRRGVGFVFQRPALWPHLTTLDNVALALVGRGIPRRERRACASRALARLKMTQRERAYPATLSGGELQRVSLARALVTKPRVLLLDEPFASLDEELRNDLASDLAALKSLDRVTILWVSHRSEDAWSLADDVLVIRNGVVEENDTEQRTTQCVSPG
ncbi:MAG: ABC transporter ATP-binding protein [Planctomycetota bacterium]